MMFLLCAKADKAKKLPVVAIGNSVFILVS
jgi:hypothetical protein